MRKFSVAINGLAKCVQVSVTQDNVGRLCNILSLVLIRMITAMSLHVFSFIQIKITKARNKQKYKGWATVDYSGG